MNRPPNDERNFVHKRLIGAVTGGIGSLVSGGNPFIGAGRGFIRGGRKSNGARVSQGQPGRAFVQPAPDRVPVRRPAPRTQVARPSGFSAAEKEAGRALKFSDPQQLSKAGFLGGGGCVFPFRIDPRTGQCRLFLGTQSGRDDDPLPQRQLGPGAAAGTPVVSGDVGEAVMGRFGAAMVPGNMVIDRAVCLPGMQLGNDGLCYNKGAITNKQRQWPKGRKPLLSGGEMRAISIAARAGSRLEGATKRLQAIGLMKTPTRRRSRPKTGAHKH